MSRTSKVQRLAAVAAALAAAIGLSGCIGPNTGVETKELTDVQRSELISATAPQIRGLYVAGFTEGTLAYRYKDGEKWHLKFYCIAAPPGHTCAEEAPEVDLVLAGEPEGSKLTFAPNELVTIERPVPSKGMPEYACQVPFKSFTAPNVIWSLLAAVRKIKTRDETPVTLQDTTLKCGVIPLPEPS